VIFAGHDTTEYYRLEITHDTTVRASTMALLAPDYQKKSMLEVCFRRPD